MPSPSTPMHGKLAALYMQRKNNFKGSGLNDLTWGTGYTGAASGYFEVVIDTVGTPDKFKWRKNGGGWTSTVSITGAAQTLSDTQTITFAATTGHTLNDQWTVGNLKTEACTESGVEAQITDANLRLLSPNYPPVFTDSGGKLVTAIEYAIGKAYFGDNVTIVTATGNNGFVLASGLQKLGYLIDWQMNLSVEMADVSRAQQAWKEVIPGQAGGSGSANAWFIGTESLFRVIENNISSQKWFLLELFNYDPDDDQTGDHFLAWVTFPSWNLGTPSNAAVKEAVNFQIHGIPSFVANS